LLHTKPKPYELVSLIYDELMKDVDYEDWAKYIVEIASGHFKKLKLKVLELSSGNCKLASILSKYYPDIIVSDLSYFMLKRNSNDKLTKVCCDMTMLPFRNKYDLIISTFDSVNYLLNKRKLLTLFNETKKILNSSGIFTFDASLESNSMEFQESYIGVGKCDGYEFKRKSKYYKNTRIHKNIFDFIDDSGTRFREIHKQKIYRFETYFDLIEKAGMHVVDCFENFTFKDGNSDSERVQFILKTDNNYADIS
jgi:hypothetical protein